MCVSYLVIVSQILILIAEIFFFLIAEILNVDFNCLFFKRIDYILAYK